EKCWKALALWLWYHEHSEVYHEHTHGGEDAAHLAFRKLAVPFIALTGVRRQGFLRYAGKPVFQHRKDAPWSLFLTNRNIRGFRFEKDCREYLAELRPHWPARSISSHCFASDQTMKRPAVSGLKRRSGRLEERGAEDKLPPGWDKFTVLTLHDERMAGV